MNIFNYSNKTVRAFTLIELMVVIAIIGLLSAIVSTPILSARKKANDARKVSDLKEVANALVMYASDYGYFPIADTTVGSSGLQDLVAKKYLNTLPTGFTNSTKDYKYILYTVGATAPNNRTGFHLLATLDTLNTALDGDSDCGSVATPCPGNTSATITSINTATANTENDGADTGGTTTTGGVFDLTGQI